MLQTKKTRFNEGMSYIQNLVDNDLKKTLQDPDLDVDDYLSDGRLKFNIAAIQLATGSTITNDKKDPSGFNIRFNGKVPTVSEIMSLCYLADKLVKMEERAGVYIDYDPDFPPEEGGNRFGFTKLSFKKMREITVGKNGSAITYQLNSMDIMNLVGLGQQIHKKKNLITALVVGGTTVAVLGGIAIGVTVHEKKKKNNMDIYELDEVIDLDPETDDDNIEVEVDTPLVEMS